MKNIFLFVIIGVSGCKILPESALNGKFERIDHKSHLTFDANGSFKFRFHRDLNWDLACGTYEIMNDSIYFFYRSDMFERTCNTEGMNDTDSVGIILQDAIDKRFRPIAAKLQNKKLITSKVGDVNDQKTIEALEYIFKKFNK